MKKRSQKIARRVFERYRVDGGKKFRLDEYDPADTAGLEMEGKEAKEMLREGVEMLADLQARLYAQDRRGVLLIFQAMDAAGKDGTIKHVMSGVNPQGVQVFSFKQPSEEELDHDYFWRCAKRLPERGRIGIFNRSYYEEVLIVRVHPEILAAQRIPEELVGKKIWKERFEDINGFERHLARQGYLILKFFLNVSRKEQKKRFLARLDEPDKHWKFSLTDVRERAFWKDYMNAYEEMIAATATEHAPWHVVPADNKWFTRLAVAATIVRALERLDLRYPEIDEKKRRELAEARRALV
ncbi:MAG: polyphosphate kinase 2 family protein [Thermoanaerobaculia bacterium]